MQCRRTICNYTRFLINEYGSQRKNWHTSRCVFITNASQRLVGPRTSGKQFFFCQLRGHRQSTREFPQKPAIVDVRPQARSPLLATHFATIRASGAVTSDPTNPTARPAEHRGNPHRTCKTSPHRRPGTHPRKHALTSNSDPRNHNPWLSASPLPRSRGAESSVPQGKDATASSPQIARRKQGLESRLSPPGEVPRALRREKFELKLGERFRRERLDVLLDFGRQRAELRFHQSQGQPPLALQNAALNAARSMPRSMPSSTPRSYVVFISDSTS